jgi:uncharacterized protein YdeI (YjbR/CyaY-like superfamily)
VAAKKKGPAKKAAATKKSPAKKTMRDARDDTPRAFKDAKAWGAWLDTHHASSSGVWIQIAKKGSGIASVNYPEVLDVALAYGWIDAIRRSFDAKSFLQRFTPRGARSIWSKINRDKALALIDSGDMKPSGLAEVQRAKEDGRWAAAYAGQKTATVPDDLAAALALDPRAAAFFATLDSQNRFAILFRLHSAKKPETRARRLATFVAMLGKGEKIYP